MKAKFQATILGILAGVALFSANALASTTMDSVSTTTAAVIATDQQLADKIASAIRRYPYYGVFDWVTGSVKDKVVTLDGAIYGLSQRDDYNRLAAHVPEVKKVVNNIQTLPASFFDDDLR